MKYKIFAVIAIAMAIGGIAFAITTNPASNVTADSDATPLTVVMRDSAGSFKATAFSLAGPLGTYPRTIAQLLAITPTLGDVYFCSNCSPAKVVVATGTSAGNFADAVGAAFK